jgi:hypothetical protein
MSEKSIVKKKVEPGKHWTRKLKGNIGSSIGKIII